MKRDIDLKLAQEVTEKKAQLKVNEDTEYNVFYDIRPEDDQKFLYIKLEEITANAPFYYNRSYTIEQLHEIHKIFKVFEKDDFEDLLSYLKDLFDNGKIKLSFADPNEDIIKVELDVILFSKSFKLDFELYREMIPNKKDEKMIELYKLNKKNLKFLKEISGYANKFKKGKAQEKKMFEKINKILCSLEIPGLENDIESVIEENPVCTNLSDKFTLNPEKKKVKINLNLKNIYDEVWPEGKMELVCKEESTIKYKKVEYPIYEIEKGKDGDFAVEFDEKELVPGAKYVCILQLFIDGKKMENSDIPLNIRVRKNKQDKK